MLSSLIPYGADCLEEILVSPSESKPEVGGGGIFARPPHLPGHNTKFCGLMHFVGLHMDHGHSLTKDWSGSRWIHMPMPKHPTWYIYIYRAHIES